ncbi:MAG: VCBS repeat-containing protein [Planctomycetes bacterium]|nr:VCBS repeat-containing protein [Planctomycetota bacterium]
MPSMTRLTLVLAASIGLGSASRAGDATLRAGAAMSVITPPLGTSINGNFQDGKAATIHDDLRVRCLALESGATRIAIATVDSCVIPREVFDRAKALASEPTGIPVDRMLFCATHTHSGGTLAAVLQSEPDPAYQAFVAVRIADAVRCAVQNLAPAELAWAIGEEPDQVFNRRWRMKEGTIPPDPFGGTTDRVRMNPPVGSPDLIEPAGPIDPAVSVLSVRSAEGRPIALLGNYSLHYIGDVGPGHISADYFGAFADRIQQLLGADRLDPPFVGMLSNGTSGDINNIDFLHRRPALPRYGRIRLVANAVAEAANRALGKATWRGDVPIAMCETKIALGVRKPDDGDIRRAKEILADAEGPVLRTRDQIYARETLFMADYPDEVELILQAIRIGDLAIVAIPCEAFVEIGLEIRERSPFSHTFTIDLANGYNGYLPTVAAHADGGYETWRARSSYLAVDAAPKIVARLLEMLRDLRGSAPRFEDLADVAEGWRGECIAKVDQSYAGWDVEIGDADDDGKPEVLVTGCPDSRLEVFEKTPEGWTGRILARNLARRTPGMGLAVRVVDIDGDGKNEIALGTGQETAQPAYFTILRTDGARILKEIFARPPLAGSAYTHNFGIHDVDGDGIQEVFAAYCGSGEVIRYDADPKLERIEARKVFQLSGSGEDSLIADVDNDGAVEYLAVSSYRVDEAKIHIFEFDPKGELLLPPRITIDEVNGRKAWDAAVEVGDVDGDGRNELVIGWKRRRDVPCGTILGYRVDGDRARLVYSFADEDEALDLGYFEKMMCIADADDDGKNELVVSTRGESQWGGGGLGRVFLYEVLPGRMVRGKVLLDFHPGKAESSWIAVGDADGDGKNEVVIATGAGDREKPGRSHVVLIEKE